MILTPKEEVECNMCGSIMWYNEKYGIYEFTNSECTRLNYEEWLKIYNNGKSEIDFDITI